MQTFEKRKRDISRDPFSEQKMKANLKFALKLDDDSVLLRSHKLKTQKANVVTKSVSQNDMILLGFQWKKL